MCGIVGYVGDRECKELLLTGLERLEYRGYDSAGIALINGSIDVTRRVGRVQMLRDAVGNGSHPATLGLAHTRWATHGGVTESNAHPIEACEGSGVTAVHNGIIENYVQLRTRLLEQGHEFHTDTDSEVISHLVESTTTVTWSRRCGWRTTSCTGTSRSRSCTATTPTRSWRRAGSARWWSAWATGETFMASAIPAFMSETRRVQYVLDDEIVVATPEGATFLTGEGAVIERPIEQVDWDEAAAEKQGYETFMLKEIHEQPDAIAETIGERLYHGELQLDGLNLDEQQIRELSRVVILACGTAYHAGLIGRYLLEEWARIPSESDIASEWRYRRPVIDERTLVDRGLAVGRDDRHDRRHEGGARTRRARARRHERDGQPGNPRLRLGAVHAGRARGRGGGVEDVHQPGGADVPAGAEAGDRARHDRRDAGGDAAGAGARAAGAGAADAGSGRPGGADRGPVLAERVLPLPGALHRAADRAGGRAQAEGDLATSPRMRTRPAR